MPRVTRGVVARKRHRRVLRAAQGYWGARHRLFRPAKDTLIRALRYSYRDRRTRKREARRLWIARINAAVRAEGMTYSRFAAALRNNGIEINRKLLAEMAIQDQEGFRSLIETAKAGLAKAAK
ncbi:MAG: 50S ribosomal protein L20 [Armatimonadetes bacterium]|nr:50S ribosomal protein L20 [Armatimonadota bacterium]NIM23952.1 50S ribosomal protein L20 [Armatimonadota bacterium]NIM67799.1 50S ribosomal protein L20 [Armatimonadota bacterium]NIM76339.1 50S ribosomal protein L20 [Armatimonadota bacterium]NIN06033.1 50S ribosomal protein L20 [Armatimonadota bacterium]